MTSRRVVSPEVRALIDDLLSGAIAAEGLATLEQELAENPAAVRFFREYCQLHINLETETRAQRAIDCFQDRGFQSALASMFPGGDLMPLEVSCRGANFFSANADDVNGGSANRRNELVDSGLRVKRGRRRLFAVACGASVALAAAMVWLVGSLEKPADHRPMTAVAPTPPVTHRAPLARMQFDSEETRYIPLSDFGHIMLEGPADLEFVDPFKVRLHKGRVKVRITSEKGHGFVVETRHGEVKDLGTEFGVDASSDKNSGVVVFEGVVNLSIPQSLDAKGAVRTERLVQGEGLTFNRRGRVSRIMSIVTGDVATFQQAGDMRIQRRDPIILNVVDNILEDLWKFYEIVPCGLKEDALTYVDRPIHEWNGMDKNGIPKYLIGADYVKPFNNDKMRHDVELSVTLGRPARLFVFMDDRVSPPPEWLRRDFKDTGDDIGLDNGPYSYEGGPYYFHHGEGPGNSIDVRFSIWERTVKQPGIIKLGPNAGATWNCGMYCIAAVSLDSNAHESDAPESDALVPDAREQPDRIEPANDEAAVPVTLPVQRLTLAAERGRAVNHSPVD